VVLLSVQTMAFLKLFLVFHSHFREIPRQYLDYGTTTSSKSLSFHQSPFILNSMRYLHYRYTKISTQDHYNISLIYSQKLALMKQVFYGYFVGAEHEYDIKNCCLALVSKIQEAAFMYSAF
jgi:hypothetical protein